MKICLLTGANTLNQSNKQLVVDFQTIQEINKQRVKGKKEELMVGIFSCKMATLSQSWSQLKCFSF